MPRFTSLLKEAEIQKNPLAMSLSYDEALSLSQQLGKRLGMAHGELDHSPSSLKRLEQRLIVYFHESKVDTADSIEILSLIRAIASYLGIVLTIHANGKWDALGTLWTTHIEFSNSELEKEGKKRISQTVVYSLGSIAAITLDKIEHGKPPKLFSLYQSAKRRKFKERL